MSIRQRQLNYTDYILEDLDHICLEIGPSRFEMKSIGSFWATGNKKRITTWKLGNRCVGLTETFNFGVLVEEIEKTNLKSEEELQTFKDEWNHNGMDTFSVGMLRVFGDNFFEFISFNEEDHPFRKPTIYNLKLNLATGEFEEAEESEESGESEESDESEESGESEESKEAEESEESGESEESTESGESEDSDKSEES